MEVSFFVTETALKGLQPNMPVDEDGMLGAFDSNRDRIYAAAPTCMHAATRARTMWNGRISDLRWPAADEMR